MLISLFNCAANFSSDSTNQWRPLHRKLGDSSNIKPTNSLVPLQLTSLQDRSEPTAQGSRGGASPWATVGRAICEGRSIEEHRVCRSSRVISSRRTDCDSEHMLDNVWSSFIRWRRAINSTKPHLDWKEEGSWSASNSWWMGQIHWWILLWWNFWCHLGLLSSLCH